MRRETYNRLIERARSDPSFFTTWIGVGEPRLLRVRQPRHRVPDITLEEVREVHK